MGEKSDTMSSALVFGSAIDTALNTMLINESLPQAIDIARRYIRDTKIDMYFPADFDEDLSIDWAVIRLSDFKTKINMDIDVFIKELLTNQGHLSENEKTFLNGVVKHSLMEKAEIILKSYYTKVLPIIGSVETVQKEIVTSDGSKRGIIDTVIILKDGRRVIFDNKTASRPYERDSVLKSPQLALYASMVNADHAGFIVMNKQITKNRKKLCSKCGYDGSGTKYRTCNNIVNKKKCASQWDETIDPYSYIQIFIDKIPEINKTLVNEAMNEVKSCVKNGIYPRNLTACFNQYGKPCVYINKCWRQNGK